MCAIGLLLAACATGQRSRNSAMDESTAIETALARDIAILASDDFGGRKPGTDGEAKTLGYLAAQWQGAGFESGTNDPAQPWFSTVDLALATPLESSMAFFHNGRKITFDESGVVIFTPGERALVDRAPMIFVGNMGDELDRAELVGRVALMLGDHAGTKEQRDALLRKGAAGVIAIIATQSRFAATVQLRRGGAYRLADEPADALDGYMTRAVAEELLGASQFAKLVKSADQSAFLPVPMTLRVTMEATSTTATVKTHNLIGRLKGKIPGSGAILILAHWDHFGSCGAAEFGDTICNGAVDNASGLAVQAELARRLVNGSQLDRDIYLLATTAEEWGLLGATAFTRDPPIPLDMIVAAFNLDTTAVAKRGADVGLVGGGLTPFDDVIAQEVAKSGRAMGNPDFASRYLKRQDGYALLRADVPAVMIGGTFGGSEALDRYTTERYHLPGDEVGGVELGGATQDLLLHLTLIRRLGNVATYPAVKANSKPAGG